MDKPTVELIKDQAKTFPPGILRPGQSLDSQIGHTVINLSDITLSEAQTKVLEKGLTFCPSPRHEPDISKIWDDIKELQRKMELTRFFNEANSDDSITFSQNDNDDPIT